MPLLGLRFGNFTESITKGRTIVLKLSIPKLELLASKR